MGRPDFALMARQQRGIADAVGETATWARFVSADALNPNSEAAGYGENNRYVNVVITGLFNPVSLAEVAQAGGYLVTGDFNATLIDALPSTQDLILWRSNNYRVVGVPITQQILGRSAYRMVIRQGQPTAG